MQIQIPHKQQSLTAFILMLISGLIMGIPMGVVSVVTTFLGDVHPIVSPLIGNTVTAFLGPILPIALTYLYYSMAARENALPQPTF